VYLPTVVVSVLVSVSLSAQENEAHRRRSYGGGGGASTPTPTTAGMTYSSVYGNLSPGKGKVPAQHLTDVVDPPPVN